VVKVASHAVDFEMPTRLWEIAENLHRAKLIALGRSAQIVGHAQRECSLVLARRQTVSALRAEISLIDPSRSSLPITLWEVPTLRRLSLSGCAHGIG